MANEKNVEILMSTYNGEKFLIEQLDSILHQTYRNISISVRDDGSKDNTLKILKRYQKNTKLEVTYGKNTGSANSFLELLRKSSDKSKYYAFSDQDDVWFKNKIENGINLLEDIYDSENIPILYCSNLKLVDKNLKSFGIENFIKIIRPSFNNSLVQNIAIGCTMIFNKKARDILITNLPFNKVEDHDWWIYTVISAFGNVIYDNNSYIYYRQHLNNAVGVSIRKSDKLKRRIKKFLKKDNKDSKYVKVFNDFYGKHLNLGQQNDVDLILNYRHNIRLKLKLIFCSNFKRQSRIDTLLIKLLVLTNKL